jgi:serine protease AprX
VRVVNLSVSGDEVWPPAPNPVDGAVAALVDAGVCVVAAAGNGGIRRLDPPATAPWAITVGGIDDGNVLDHRVVMLWHGNYGVSHDGGPKPEIVAPSIRVVAPVLPISAAAAEAAALFEARLAARAAQDTEEIAAIDARLGERHLVTPHYQHAEGTSFAAPLVSGTIACMLEAKPLLTPRDVRAHLHRAAWPVPGVPAERQGAGALDAGRSIAFALGNGSSRIPASPDADEAGVRFSLHDRDAEFVEVLGSWDDWTKPVATQRTEPGLWNSARLALGPGMHRYKFRLDSGRWLDDPANPLKQPDGRGGFNSLFHHI